MTLRPTLLTSWQILSYREGAGEGLDDTMGEVANILQDCAGVEINSVDVGANDDARSLTRGCWG